MQQTQWANITHQLDLINYSQVPVSYFTFRHYNRNIEFIHKALGSYNSQDTFALLDCAAAPAQWDDGDGSATCDGDVSGHVIELISQKSRQLLWSVVRDENVDTQGKGCRACKLKRSQKCIVMIIRPNIMLFLIFTMFPTRTLPKILR